MPDERSQYEWNLACDLYVARFLHDLGLDSPDDIGGGVEPPRGSEQTLFGRISERIEDNWRHWSTAGPDGLDMVEAAVALDQNVNLLIPGGGPVQPIDWPGELARRIATSARRAVNQVGDGPDESETGLSPELERALSWFITSFPLLGAMAASFDIIEDTLVCQRQQITIAAVRTDLKEIYINPAQRLSEQELRFVLAHELFHVGLRHDTRIQGRDPFLWNVACDYVINGWLVELGVGTMPSFGALYDPELDGWSAEEVYDWIVDDLANLRRHQRMATLAGKGQGDVLSDRPAAWWRSSKGIALDEFYRSVLSRGLELHSQQARGLLPAGLVEEIRSLTQPPIPWDVELARLFDTWFPAVERRRTYARASRRQSATPDIPRPAWHTPEELQRDRTLAVVLDTSASMDRELLGKGLGAIASYAVARDVGAIRLVFCDAKAHDAGYVTPESLGARVRVTGRGGTKLQPAITLLERAKDFPSDGPMLIITDGLIEDQLRFKRDYPHAFLLPEGHRLPFRPRGEVFRLS